MAFNSGASGASAFNSSFPHTTTQTAGQPAGATGTATESGGTRPFGGVDWSKFSASTGNTTTTLGQHNQIGQQPAAQQQQQQQQQQQPSTTAAHTFGIPSQPRFGQPTSHSASFGQNSTTNPAPNTARVLGQSTSTQPVFNQSTTTPSGLFGPEFRQASQQSQRVGQRGQGVGLLKFSDLPESAQKQLQGIDEFIKQQKQKSSEVNTEHLPGAIRQTSADVKSTETQIQAFASTITHIHNRATYLGTELQTEIKDIESIQSIIQGMISAAAEGRLGGSRSAEHKEWPLNYFNRVADMMTNKVAGYRKSVAELNRAIASLATGDGRTSPGSTHRILHKHLDRLRDLAAQVETLEFKMHDMRRFVTERHQEVRMSARDPFQMAREQKGLPPRTAFVPSGL